VVLLLVTYSGGFHLGWWVVSRMETRRLVLLIVEMTVLLVSWVGVILCSRCLLAFRLIVSRTAYTCIGHNTSHLHQALTLIDVSREVT
jgi:hypothetical protein